ncbi:hypothetical protein N7451_012418 [Penicillium sp. IBT 35674x]|nr:hypothetical protein N7451_012418 [Penicillium sp. IBT 35674x]
MSYLASTIVLIGKVLRQPAIGEILQHVHDAAKCTQNLHKDIAIIKDSVGLGTTPLVSASFTGGRTTTATWAQIAAQAKGAPALPPPLPQGMHTTKTQSADKDRVIVARIKDYGTTAEAAQLKQNEGSIKGLEERAELVLPTHGVIVHGIPANSIDTKDQEATIQRILADNYTVSPNAETSYLGWLTKEATLKQQNNASAATITVTSALNVTHPKLVAIAQSNMRRNTAGRRDIYWHVPLKENIAQPEQHSIQIDHDRQTQSGPLPAPIAAVESENETPAGTNALEHPDPGTSQDDMGPVDQPAEQTPERDPAWQPDPATDPLPPSHPIDNIEDSEKQGADDWLNGIADEIGDIWLYGPPEYRSPIPANMYVHA